MRCRKCGDDITGMYEITVLAPGVRDAGWWCGECNLWTYGENDVAPTPCIHTDGRSLCPDCQIDYNTDPGAYEEFGAHSVGLENRRRQDAERELEIAEAMRRPQVPVDWDEVPL